MKTGKTWLGKGAAALISVALASGGAASAALANYTTGFEVPGAGHDFGTATWDSGNKFASEGVDFSSQTVGQMMKTIENFDFEAFKKDHQDLPWLDSLLVNKGVIPDDIDDEGGANTLFSRGSALFMKTQDNSKLGFAGQVYYADTLNQEVMYSVSLSTGGVREDKNARKNYPSHEDQTYTSGSLQVRQKKFITYYNSAVTLLDFHNPTSGDVKLTIKVKSPFAAVAEGDEMVGKRVAAPLMIGTDGSKFVKAMSYVDVRLSGNGMKPGDQGLVKEIVVPAGGTASQKITMGWLADEIPKSKTQYEEYKNITDNGAAFERQVKEYNQWWADNIPYIDIPDENVKKVLYYRWWCNRFNLLEANIPGNDWQFPMNMEGVLGYNNGITVSVPWAMQDLKWLRNPVYAYGTWLAQGEYSENKNYKNNPGRPNIWTWDMMQNTSQVGWEAYKIYGGGNKLLKKFADISANDVTGTLEHFKGTDPYLVYYNHAPITGNDGDTVSMHWNGGGNYARLDGTSTTYANAVAAAEMYDELGDSSAANKERDLADNIRSHILSEMWYDGADFDGDGKADTKGEGSFLHKKIVNGADTFVPWRDNNMFVFNFGVVPTAKENGYQSKYLTQLADYDDPQYYPIFPFFTADQHSIMKRLQAFVDGKTDAYGTDQFAWCNFGNYINTIRASLRYYPVDNINADTYKKLFDWGAWLHTVEPGNTDHLDSNEFFWLENYFFGTQWTKDNPPNPSGDMVRSWIHHDTLGMMNYTVMEDMAGIQPRTDDKIELWPIGIGYDHFAVDNVRYHDANLSIVWQDPAKYQNNPYYKGIPAGFSLFINGERVLTTSEMSHVIYDTKTGKAELPKSDIEGAAGNNANTQIWYEKKGEKERVASAKGTSLAGEPRVVDLFNKAGIDLQHQGENLAMASGTTITSTYVSPDSDINRLADGSTIASTDHAGNTALLGGSPNPSDTVTFDFGKKKPVNNVKVYFYNDRLEGGYGTPQQFLLEYLDADGNAWKPVQGQTRYPETIASNYNNVEFETVKTQAIRLRVTHALDAKTGIKEVQIYDNKLKNVAPAVNQAPKVYIGQTERTAAQDETVSILPAIYDDGLSGKELSYRWSKASGSGSVEEMQTDRAELKAVFHDVGEYVYTLTVSDGEKETAVDVHITVSVPTQDIVDMIHAYAPRDNGKIVRNKDDFTPESWDALQTALTEAKTLLAGQNYTREQVEAVRAKLKKASDGLQVKNVALLAKATTSYVSPWESIAGVNDGYIPYTSASIGKPEDEVQYGNWADPAESHWLLYTWDRPVKLSQSSIYFYDDGGGVKVPADYSLEYWDQASNEFKPVTGLSGKAMNKDRFNDVSFDEITTTKLRLHLIRQSGAWTGVKEWRVLGPEAVAGNPGNGSNKPVLSIDPVEVETVIGVAPQLPATVNVTFADQTKGTKPVTWNEVPYNELTTAHSFVVLGRVEGTEQSASCRITVTYDKTELKSLIGQARDMLDHQEQYEATPEQWKALKDALAAAQTAADDKSATEGDIKAASERLKTALDTFNIQK